MGQNIYKADGFGTMWRWDVLSARQVTIGEQTFWNLQIRPVARVNISGDDVPNPLWLPTPAANPVQIYNVSC